MYDFYTFIPFLDYFEQICSNCFFKNKKLSILYSVMGNNCYSHKFNEDLDFIIEKKLVYLFMFVLI